MKWENEMAKGGFPTPTETMCLKLVAFLSLSKAVFLLDACPTRIIAIQKTVLANTKIL